MNWGYRVAALYISFVAMMLLLVSMAVKQSFDLVSDDYYSQQIDYQNRINKIKNTQRLTEPLRVSVLEPEKSLVIQYPKGLDNISGKILLYRPTDAKKDVLIDITTNEKNEQVINTSQFQNGLWRLKIDWKANETEYYNEEVVVFNY